MDNPSMNISSNDTSSTDTTTAEFVYMFILAVDIILNLTLNLFGLIVLCRVSNIQPATKVFLRSLTVSDLSIALFYALPLLINKAIPDLLTDLSFCRYQIVTGSIVFNVNILSLLLLTTDRYVSIVHCLRYLGLMTVTKARMLACLPWALSITYTAIYFTLRPPKYSNKSYICLHMKEPVNFSIIIAIIVTSLFTILALYVHIAVIAHRHNRRIAQENPTAWANPVVAPFGFRTKSLQTILIITISVVICWLPEVIALMVAKTTNEYYALSWTFLVQIANCWLNTVIYYLRNKDIRQAAHNILCSCFSECAISL